MDSLPLLLLVVFALGYSGVNGRLLRYGEQVSNHNETVPSGCVTPGEYVLQMSVMAAPWHTSQEDCESKPDRCFWSDGWDTRRRNMMTAICYYSKDSVCYQYRGAKIKYLRLSAKQCEAENHCYNYKNNKCYDVL